MFGETLAGFLGVWSSTSEATAAVAGYWFAEICLRATVCRWLITAFVLHDQQTFAKRHFYYVHRCASASYFVSHSKILYTQCGCSKIPKPSWFYLPGSGLSLFVLLLSYLPHDEGPPLTFSSGRTRSLSADLLSNRKGHDHHRILREVGELNGRKQRWPKMVSPCLELAAGWFLGPLRSHSKGSFNASTYDRGVVLELRTVTKLRSWIMTFAQVGNLKAVLGDDWWLWCQLGPGVYCIVLYRNRWCHAFLLFRSVSCLQLSTLTCLDVKSVFMIEMRSMLIHGHPQSISKMFVSTCVNSFFPWYLRMPVSAMVSHEAQWSMQHSWFFSLQDQYTCPYRILSCYVMLCLQPAMAGYCPLLDLLVGEWALSRKKPGSARSEIHGSKGNKFAPWCHASEIIGISTMGWATSLKSPYLSFALFFAKKHNLQDMETGRGLRSPG